MGISDDIINQIQNALNAGISKDNLKQTAKELAESIQKRTRLGKSVKKDGASLSQLEPLDNKYKIKRKKLQKQGKLSNKTKPAKSNLTKSGEMLDNINSRATNESFEVYIDGNNNKEKAKYVQVKRPFMNIAKFEIKFIIENIIDRIRRSAK